MTRAAILAAMALAACASSGSHQAVAQSSASCSVDRNAAWYRKQTEWLDESAHQWTGDSLRRELLKATGFAAGSPAVQLGIRFGTGPSGAVSPDAAAFIAAMRRIPRGQPGATRSVVGPAGMRAFFTLALADTSFTVTAMHRMMEAGPDESLAADVAVLDDLFRLRAGRKQVFGTHFVRAASGVALAPMEDSAHADMRREGAGLPPLAQALCLARTQ